MRLLLAATLVAGSATFASAQDGPPKVGERFPALAFPNLETGELSSIADFEGTKVLLVQFASW